MAIKLLLLRTGQNKTQYLRKAYCIVFSDRNTCSVWLLPCKDCIYEEVPGKGNTIII